jgi:hypothetical protein
MLFQMGLQFVSFFADPANKFLFHTMESFVLDNATLCIESLLAEPALEVSTIAVT